LNSQLENAARRKFSLAILASSNDPLVRAYSYLALQATAALYFCLALSGSKLILEVLLPGAFQLARLNIFHQDVYLILRHLFLGHITFLQ
jgi:hypothetical protein